MLPAVRGTSRARALAGVVLAALWISCGGVAPTGPAPAPEPATVDGWVRLDRSVVPRRYDLDLRVDPRGERFSGEVGIEVELSRPTREIALHAERLELVSARVVSGGRELPARPVPGLHGGLLLVLEEAVAAGRARIEIAWQADFAKVSHGLYRVLDRERWYAFTQFQPLSARSVFPSFDQPEFKTPFRVKLRVPRHMMAVSSGPMVSRVTRGEERTFIFDETKPIPTYLLALAVGEFDAVPVPEGEGGGPVMRILTPHGRGELGAFAAGKTRPILEYLVDWFGHPMPFAKLDQIAVPEFSFGAMENVGLVTYREQGLLHDPVLATQRERLWTEITMAHELAHMWFGNWVTLPWWDDLWLNESFATWMQTKVVDALSPELEAGLGASAHLQYVMYLDSKRDARAVRQPVRTGGDVYNAFDGITYGKGAAVLRMVEAWVGEEAFREGVRAYLEDHAYGSGGTAELLAALDRATGKPVASVVRSLVDRPGAPLVTAELECDAGETDGPATVELSQERYQPAGRDTRAEPWALPVCMRWEPEAGGGGRACFLLSEQEETVALPTDRCPSWVHPNAGELGYYRWRLPEEAQAALVRTHWRRLALSERLALPGGLRALLEAGHVSTATYLDGLLALSKDGHRRMAEAITPGLWSLSRALDEADEEAFAHFVTRALGPYLEQIGLVPAVSESRDAGQLRARLLPALGDLGRDRRILERARRAADAFLAGEAKGYTVEELRVLVPMASWEGDAAHWERVRSALVRADRPARRQRLVSALGSFDDPALAVRSLELVLDGTLRASEWGGVAGGTRRTARRAVWEWTAANHDALVARLGRIRGASLPRMASGLCSERDHEAVERFFEGKPALPGRQLNLALALEDIERCIQARETLAPPMREWLAELPEREEP